MAGRIEQPDRRRALLLLLLGEALLVGCSGSEAAGAAPNASASTTVSAALVHEGESPATAPTTSAPKHTRSRDCDPARPNSDGTPKRAPAGPPSRPGETLVLAYDDFGPQAAAVSILGSEWWAWEPGGSWEICDAFDIRVVVYKGLSEKQVRAMYPTATSSADLVQRGLADYRYVERGAALAYIDATLAEIAGEPELERMAERLNATRKRIIQVLGP